MALKQGLLRPHTLALSHLLSSAGKIGFVSQVDFGWGILTHASALQTVARPSRCLGTEVEVAP